MRLVEQLVLSPGELALLADLGGLNTPIPVGAPELDGNDRQAIADGLVARGVLVARDGEPRLAEAVQPLLGVALLAPLAVNLQFESFAEQRSVTLLSADEAAVVHQRVEGGLHRLVPFDLGDLHELLGVVLDVPALVGGPGADATPPALSEDDFTARIGDLVERDDRAWSVRVVDVAEQSNEGEAAVCTVIALADSDGLWLADTGAGPGAESVSGETAYERLLAAAVAS